MTQHDILTTSDVARYCRVTTDGVLRWIRADKLKAFATPGGHYRIYKSDFREFLERFRMPIDQEFFVADRPRILVVDDEPVIVDIISQSLLDQNEGYVIETAVDGYDAGFKLGSFRPDLVIMDLLMPVIDGFELCRRIRSNPDTVNTKVLAITGYPGGNALERMYQIGADLCLVKPLQLDQLRREVARLLTDQVD
jgi:excisionase family DNA binding protein